MADMNYWLDRQYALLQQQAAKPAGVTTGVPAGGVLPGKISDPFAGLKAGETKTVGSFTGEQIGPTTVVRGQTNNELDRLRTQGVSVEDAAKAVVAQSAARLDTTRAGLLPRQTEAEIAQSRAQTGLLGAQTNLTGQQARIVVPESQARIRGVDADIGLTGANTVLARRRAREIDPNSAVATEFLNNILAGYGGYRLGQ